MATEGDRVGMAIVLGGCSDHHLCFQTRFAPNVNEEKKRPAPAP